MSYTEDIKEKIIKIKEEYSRKERLINNQRWDQCDIAEITIKYSRELNGLYEILSLLEKNKKRNIVFDNKLEEIAKKYELNFEELKN